MKLHRLPPVAIALLLINSTAPAQPLVNLGLVGVGRLPAGSFDQLGAGIDTLGGIFSGMFIDPASITKSGDIYSATIYSLPDRGFGDGLRDYHPRIQILSFRITPYFGPGPVGQDQIVFTNTGTILFTQSGRFFTGALPDDTNVTTHPQSLPTSIGLGKWSLDPEGIVVAPNGTVYVSDEYGPFIFHFDGLGALLNIIKPPEAWIPKVGTNYPFTINHNQNIEGTNSGRFNNRGMEGLSITPDGKKLVGVSQSPLAQDGLNRNPSRNTRIILFDIDSTSATYHMPVAEYVVELTLNAAEALNRHTPLSEILALSDTRFLIVERDSRGRGGDPGPLLYKRIVSVDVSGASNIVGTGYDLEKGAPGQLSLPRSGLPSNVVAVARSDLVDLLNLSQLTKFGLNTLSSNQNENTVSEKWEGLGVIPLGDPAAPNDYLLLVGNDNDFKAALVYHNGEAVGTNDFNIDNMLLAFRIGEDHTPPTLTCPAEATVVAYTNCGLPSVASVVTATDNSAAPIEILQDPPVGAPVTLGQPLTVTARARDAAGNESAPCTFTVTVTDQTGPIISVPATITVATEPGACAATVSYTASATDNCGVASFACVPPSDSVFAKGTNVVTCTATDLSGNSATRSFQVIVLDTNAPVIVSVTPSRRELWPPLGILMPVTLSVDAFDDCDQPRCEIVSVTNSELDSGCGGTVRDWRITGPLSVSLRAKRSGSALGRVYTISVRCMDSSGNSATNHVTVLVPHDQRKSARAKINGKALQPSGAKR